MNERTKNLIIALAWAVSITALCALGVFRRPELWVEDEIFQNPVAVPGDIVIIGIDENDIKEFGPYSSWDRSIMASALEKLGKYMPVAISAAPAIKQRIAKIMERGLPREV